MSKSPCVSLCQILSAVFVPNISRNCLHLGKLSPSNPPSLEDHCKARRYAPVVEHATPTKLSQNKRVNFLLRHSVVHSITCVYPITCDPVWGRGTSFPPLSPCPFTSPSFALFHFFLFSVALTIFFVCPALSFPPG